MIVIPTILSKKKINLEVIWPNVLRHDFDAVSVVFYKRMNAKPDRKTKYLIQPLHFFHIWKVDLWTSNIGQAWAQIQHSSAKWPPALSREVKKITKKLILVTFLWACGTGKSGSCNALLRPCLVLHQKRTYFYLIKPFWNFFKLIWFLPNIQGTSAFLPNHRDRASTTSIQILMGD